MTLLDQTQDSSDDDFLRRAREALAPLIAEEAQRQGRRSPYSEKLAKLRPMIVEARGKKHSWKRIAQQLRSADLIDATPETLRRHIMADAAIGSATGRSTRKKRKKAARSTHHLAAAQSPTTSLQARETTQSAIPAILPDQPVASKPTHKGRQRPRL